MLSIKGWNGLSLLANAACQEDKIMFEVVLATVRGRLGIDKVRNQCLALY